MKCKHPVIQIFGNEEQGVKSAKCGRCGVPMGRRVVEGEYEYYPLDPNRENPSFDRRDDA